MASSRQRAADCGFTFTVEADPPPMAPASGYGWMFKCAHITCGHQLCREHGREAVVIAASHIGAFDSLLDSGLADESDSDPVATCTRNRKIMMKHIVAGMVAGTDAGLPDQEVIRGLGLTLEVSHDGEQFALWCAHADCDDAGTSELVVFREDLQRLADLRN